MLGAAAGFIGVVAACCRRFWTPFFLGVTGDGVDSRSTDNACCSRLHVWKRPAGALERNDGASSRGGERYDDGIACCACRKERRTGLVTDWGVARKSQGRALGRSMLSGV